MPALRTPAQGEDARPCGESAVLTRAELAQYLNRSVASIDRDMAGQRLPAPLRFGKSVRWLRSEIDAWLQAGAPDRATWEKMKARAAR